MVTVMRVAGGDGNEKDTDFICQKVVEFLA
jgi:hypothetical protein